LPTGPAFHTSFRFSRLILVIAVLFFFLPAGSQVCQGSFGDPVVNMNFAPNVRGAEAYAPGYTYTSNVCPNDGFYTVTNTIGNCFNNVWVLTNDHTGDGSGFMLVNASYTPGDFFLTSITNLCPGTTYEFAAWITNVMAPPTGIRPNITFKIETLSGAVLQQFSTGDIDIIGQWQKYGLFFTTPSDNPVIVLRMTNNAPGGYGNDLAIDDITFRPCGPVVQAGIQGYGDTVEICEGNQASYTFGATVSSGYQSPAYQWQVSTDSGFTWRDIPGATVPVFQRLPTAAPGKYFYRLTVIDVRVAGLTHCRIASNGVLIHVHPKPVVDAGRDRIMLGGRGITLAATAEGEGISYSWTPIDHMNDAGSLNPAVSPPGDIIYKLSAVSAFGCTNEDDVAIKVVAGIFVPNAFTPNNDGRNDTWEIPYLDPAFGAEVSVFNRWGQLVYRTAGSVVSWDGTLNGIAQGAGTYVYFVRSKEYDINIKGTITLIR
jgi:gliding motility-associated-like protein